MKKLPVEILFEFEIELADKKKAGVPYIYIIILLSQIAASFIIYSAVKYFFNADYGAGYLAGCAAMIVMSIIDRTLSDKK